MEWLRTQDGEELIVKFSIAFYDNFNAKEKFKIAYNLVIIPWDSGAKHDAQEEKCIASITD